MKRYSLIGLLLILAAVAVSAAVIEVPEAPARMTAVVVGGGGGGGAAPACTVDNDSAIFDNLGITTDGQCSAWRTAGLLCTKFTTASNYIITQYRQRYASLSTTGNNYMHLYTDNAGVPGSEISGTLSPAVNITSATTFDFTLETPYDYLSAGTYWLCSYGNGEAPDSMVDAADVGAGYAWKCSTDAPVASYAAASALMGCAK